MEGFEGRWTKNPLVFDNTYYKEILSEKSKYLKLEADEELAKVRRRLKLGRGAEEVRVKICGG